jgi:hypothetical protein
MLTIKKGDYVIGTDNKKNFLMLVNHIADGTISGVLDTDRAYAPKNAEFEAKNIVCVLGDKPAAGSSYGCLIEPYRTTLVHPTWGNVHVHMGLKSEQKVSIKAALDKTAKRLKDAGLLPFLNLGAVELELRPPKGKYNGMYHFKQKVDKAQDRLILRPQEGYGLDYVILHEAGHGVWFRLLSPQIHARWIKLYNNYTKLKEFEPHHFRKLRDSYIEASVSIGEFKGQLEEDQAILFDNLIGTLCSSTRLTRQNLNTLADTQGLDAIKKDWPTYVNDTDFEIAVTEYGTKNVEELFAESFAFYMTGQKLPKRINTVLEKTLAYAKQNAKSS